MADLILAGADVITLHPQRPAASAVAITGGRITAVGDRHDVRDWRGTRTEFIDLGGATLVPGLTDSLVWIASPADDLLVAGCGGWGRLGCTVPAP